MASTTFNTIVVRTNNPDNMQQRVREGLANGAITPGELLIWDSTVNDLNQHATAGGNSEGKKVAIENPWSDHGSGKAIDHPYADNETVRFIFAQTGDQLYMFLADGQTVSQGASLVSDATGALAAGGAQAVNEAGSATYTVYPDGVVGYAAEDKAASGARARILVDIA